jgi:alpha-L-fucosidase
MIFNWPKDGKFVVPAVASPVTKAYLLAGRKPVEFKSADNGVTLSLPTTAPDPVASVVCLDIKDK